MGRIQQVGFLFLVSHVFLGPGHVLCDLALKLTMLHIVLSDTVIISIPRPFLMDFFSRFKNGPF